MPHARSDQLTCSAKCRTRRYRAAKARPAKGSRPFRLALVLAQPKRFYWRRADDDSRYPSDWHEMPAEQWDQTMELLNRFYQLRDCILIMQGWQGDQGYNTPARPQEDDPYLDHLPDVAGAILQEVSNMRELAGMLQALRGEGSRYVGQHLGTLTKLTAELMGPIRQFVRSTAPHREPYEVVYSPELVEVLSRLEDWVEARWFEVYDN